MVWFVVSTVIYFAVIAGLLYFIHKEGERVIRDRTVTPETELMGQRGEARAMRLRGVQGTATTDGAGEKKGLGCVSRFFLLLYMAVMVVIPCIFVVLVRNALIPDGYTRIRADDLLFPLFAAGAFGFLCLVFAPFASTKLNGAFERRFGKEKIKAIFNISAARTFKIFLLFTFIVAFPFFSFSPTTYLCYNETEIRYQAFFAISETVTEYGQVKSVEKYFHRNSNGKISSMHYIITLSDGKTIDPLFDGERVSSGYVDQTYKLHGYIKAAQPDLFTEKCDEPIADINTFLHGCSEATYAKVMFIFGFT